MTKLNFGREKGFYKVSTSNVYKIPTITEEERARIEANAKLCRRLLAEAKLTQKENKKILKALKCQHILDTEGFSPTLLDFIWADREYREEKYAKMVLHANSKLLIKWYQLYRGFMPEFAKGPFDPAEDYWLTFQQIHDHSNECFVPTQNIRFRRNYSMFVSDRVPEEFQNLFLDMFNFLGRYGRG